MTTNKLTIDLIEVLEKHNINLENFWIETHILTGNIYIKIDGKLPYEKVQKIRGEQ